MKKFFIISFILLLKISVSAQLNPLFWGEYLSKDKMSTFYLYVIEEEMSGDCFFVEYQHFESAESVYGESGKGRCLGNNNFLFLMESEKGQLKAKIELDESQIPHLFVTDENGKKEEFVQLVFQEYLEEDYSETYYSSPDGKEIMLVEEGDGLHFSFYTREYEICPNDEVNGLLIPVANYTDRYQFYITKTCSIQLEIKEDKVIVTQWNCDAMKKGKCGNWSGIYSLND